MDNNKINDLISRAIDARKNAYAPYSKFLVGSVIYLKNQEIYTGANIENSSYSVTICAERAAMVPIIMKNLQNEIIALAVATDTENPSSPCGVCRQFLSEFLLPTTTIILANTNKKYILTSLQELLPMAFSKNDLNK